ncbi:DgyrCDS11116 [Dimorphilus gyrociliatus]|uniref:DgyrCDS11116 n=1 Tax=Dimorphilus gyrociliatus TaxID=2664684 RepID=A0A7I8W2E3_9ANNE|nr:DgyrCDS11116 [Dimorphilus gyrociliatus]
MNYSVAEQETNATQLVDVVLVTLNSAATKVSYPCNSRANKLADSHPESPGNCMKEKDLNPCSDSGECGPGVRCVPLGPNREKYCLARYPSQHHSHVPETGRKSGDIGADCETDDDCKDTTDENDRLCCQVVTFFRRKPRKMCDRIHYDTKCIL